MLFIYFKMDITAVKILGSLKQSLQKIGDVELLCFSGCLPIIIGQIKLDVFTGFADQTYFEIKYNFKFRSQHPYLGIVSFQYYHTILFVDRNNTIMKCLIGGNHLFYGNRYLKLFHYSKYKE